MSTKQQALRSMAKESFPSQYCAIIARRRGISSEIVSSIKG
jgi:sulfur relay (sulfurtransferase) complex TusBCD TusD component (DsrE family)